MNLQISSLRIKYIDYKFLIEKSVYSTEKRDCMMNIYPKCSRKEGVKTFLSGLEPLMTRKKFKNKQWISTDRCTLIEVVEFSEYFMTSLCQNCEVNKTPLC